jgi:hypothetical protein
VDPPGGVPVVDASGATSPIRPTEDRSTTLACGGSLAGSIYTTGPITADCTVLATFTASGTDLIFADGFERP